MKKKSDYIISGIPIMGTETVVGQRHRRGVLWVITGLECGTPGLKSGGAPIFEGVSFKWDINMKLDKGFRSII